MKLTNKFGLPQPYVDACSHDDYDGGQGGEKYTISQLISPPRHLALKQRHDDEIHEDVADRVFQLLGKVSHRILEDSNCEGHLAEKRLYMDVNGIRISGKFDSLELSNGVLSDWKVVSLWRFKDEPKEIVEQLNCYTELLRVNGFTVNAAQAVGILRDHSKNRARKDPTYNQHPVIKYPIPLWTREETQKFIAERVRLHEEALLLPTEALPECSDEERWMEPKFAVMKEGAKRAIRLTDTEAEANAIAIQKGPGHYTQKRGEPIRCLAYCLAAPFCSQYRQYQLGQGVNNAN